MLAPTLNLPLCLFVRSFMSNSMFLYTNSSVSVCCKSVLPAAVTLILFPFLSNSCSLKWLSNSCMCLVTAGCVMYNSSAALVKLTRLATV